MNSQRAGVTKSLLTNVILSEAKNLGSNPRRSVTETDGDVGKPGLMLRIALQRFAQHDSAIYEVATNDVRRASSLPAVCLQTRRPTLMG